MDDERLPKRLFYSELTVGKWSVGGQRKRYKDTLKASLKDFNINPESWKGLAAERCTWRSLIRKGAISSEKNRVCQTEKKRELRKSGATSASTPGSVHDCSTCSRTFCAQIGLISHSRTHRPQSLDQWVMAWSLSNGLMNNIVPLRGRYSINNTFLRNNNTFLRNKNC